MTLHPTNATHRTGLGLLGALLLTGCGFQKPTWYTYEESGRETADSIQKPAPASKPISLQWTTPDGWNEERGTGMRLASFTIDRNGRVGTCTLLTLAGTAGGLEANVRRWIGQLNLEAPSPDELKTFLDRQKEFQSEGGLNGICIDLTEMGGRESDTPSMLSAMIPLDGMTLFIKLTGPLGLIKEEKDSFLKLCRSLRSKT